MLTEVVRSVVDRLQQPRCTVCARHVSEHDRICFRGGVIHYERSFYRS